VGKTTSRNFGKADMDWGNFGAKSAVGYFIDVGESS